jgi:hypothetical protein
MRTARSRVDRATPWRRGILAPRPVKVAVLARAAKTVRIAWAELVKVPTASVVGMPAEGMLISGETYRSPAAAAV